MWLRTLSAVAVVGGLLGAAYLGWACHRLSYEVMRSDRQWPRPWPYPDRWLLRWARRLDAEDRRRSAAEAAERGVPPGLKMEGEVFAVRLSVGAGAAGCLVVSAAGLVPVVIRHRRRAAARAATGEAGDYAEEFRTIGDRAAAEPDGAPDRGGGK